MCQCNAKVGYPWLFQSSVDVGFQHTSINATSLECTRCKGFQQDCHHKNQGHHRDTTGTGHRLKAFEDLRCQTDRTSCQELILMKKMECLRLKPKPPNLIPALYLLTFCCQASRGLSFVLKKPSTICGTNSSPNSLVPLYKLALVCRLQRLLGN